MRVVGVPFLVFKPASLHPPHDRLLWRTSDNTKVGFTCQIMTRRNPTRPSSYFHSRGSKSPEATWLVTHPRSSLVCWPSRRFLRFTRVRSLASCLREFCLSFNQENIYCALFFSRFRFVICSSFLQLTGDRWSCYILSPRTECNFTNTVLKRDQNNCPVPVNGFHSAHVLCKRSFSNI